MLAVHVARTWPNPQIRIDQIDRTLMFLGRYANQSAIHLLHQPVDQIYAWARHTAELLREEAEAMKSAAKGG